MCNLQEEKEAIQLLTEKYVAKLTDIWKLIFHHDKCQENLRKLADHATNFYEELVMESLSRKSFIESEIKDLEKEAEDLRRLLKTNVKLPSYARNNVPLLTIQSDLDKSLEDLREQLRLRKQEICELLLEQEALCEELGEAPRALLADPLPTAEEIEHFRKHLEALREEKVERMNKIFTMRREIKSFLQILELQVNTENEDRLLNHRQIKMNKETFNGLNNMYDLYSSQVKQLKETIQPVQKKLNTLWDRLQTSPKTRNKFNRYNDCNEHTYNVLYSELQGCETLKSQNIQKFIQQIRREIEKLWEKTLKSDVQKSRFTNFTSTCYTDDLLVLHEMELEDLKLYYETNKQIFELYNDRNILWECMNALEAKALEPGRFNNRGGQLLKEEKERKTIATKLPKIEQQITELVKEYEEREHAPFLVYGENIIEVMAAQWEQKRREKEMFQAARKNSNKLAASGTTKPNSTLRTPLSLNNASSVSSLRKTPSTISLVFSTASSQKRKLNPSDRYTPLAKRSLMQALNSPSIFQKPSTSKANIQNSANKTSKAGTNFKSPFKKTKIIATTIRRRSGRLSSSSKKRRSIHKKPSSAKAVPQIVIENCQSDGYSTDCISDETYESFQKCIEPTARSSMPQSASHNTKSSHNKRMQKVVEDNMKLSKLPRPPVANRTPSKQHISVSNRTRTPTNGSPGSGVITNRKLTTKNLPIII